MSNQDKTSERLSGIILQKDKIAEHTFHIKMQSTDFSKIKYIDSKTCNVFLTNPYYNSQSEVRKYSFWAKGNPDLQHLIQRK